MRRLAVFILATSLAAHLVMAAPQEIAPTLTIDLTDCVPARGEKEFEPIPGPEHVPSETLDWYFTRSFSCSIAALQRVQASLSSSPMNRPETFVFSTRDRNFYVTVPLGAVAKFQDAGPLYLLLTALVVAPAERDRALVRLNMRLERSHPGSWRRQLDEMRERRIPGAPLQYGLALTETRIMESSHPSLDLVQTWYADDPQLGFVQVEQRGANLHLPDITGVGEYGPGYYTSTRISLVMEDRVAVTIYLQHWDLPHWRHYAIVARDYLSGSLSAEPPRR